MEVESSKTKQALSESQARNQHLQEQVAMQRQVLKEMEQQLQSSHQLTAQLRAQVRGSARGCRGGVCMLGSPCGTGQRRSTWGPTDPFPVALSLLAVVTKGKFLLICKMV